MDSTERIQNKVAWVTGAGQGIGRATAYRLAAEGAKVAVNDLDTHPDLQAVARETGGIAVAGDISDATQVETMVKEIEERIGQVEILVANAAYMTMAPFLEQDPDDWWRHINVNLTGHLSCIHAVLPGMKEIGGGRIIIISSMFGIEGWKNASAYGASKSGLTALGEAMAAELRSENIHVGIIHPGVIDTPQLQVDADDLNISLDEVKAMYAKDIPMDRVGDPEEVAATVAFLAAEGGPAFSGQVLQINGGLSRCSR
ncbi:MAG: SDR family oxidoreductase [Desulfobacterales bacterium]|nr:MAG: SDR family oxidoreductase [Desulfobacterales bacterium]